MKDELNFSHNDGGDAYLLQSVAIHFNHTVESKSKKPRNVYKYIKVSDFFYIFINVSGFFAFFIHRMVEMDSYTLQ